MILLIAANIKCCGLIFNLVRCKTGLFFFAISTFFNGQTSSWKVKVAKRQNSFREAFILSTAVKFQKGAIHKLRRQDFTNL